VHDVNGITVTDVMTICVVQGDMSDEASLITSTLSHNVKPTKLFCCWKWNP